MQTQASTATVSLSAIAALWSGSKGSLALTEGLNAVMGVSGQQGYFRKRFMGIRSYLLSFAMLAGFLALHTAVPWALTLLPVCVLIALLYRVLPRRKLSVRSCMIGGIFAGLGLSVLSEIFSLYVRFFDKYHLVYGSIGLLVLVFMWLRLGILLVLYGAILGDLLEKKAYHPIKILKNVIS